MASWRRRTSSVFGRDDGGRRVKIRFRPIIGAVSHLQNVHFLSPSPTPRVFLVASPDGTWVKVGTMTFAKIISEKHRMNIGRSLIAPKIARASSHSSVQVLTPQLFF